MPVVSILADRGTAGVVGIRDRDDVRAVASRSTAAWIAVVASGLVSPSGAWKTTFEVKRVCSGNRSARASAAFWESAPGSRNVSSDSPPTDELSMRTERATTIQAAITRHG